MAITHPDQCRYRRNFNYAYGYTPPTFTYIISCDGADLLKIGKSNSPEWRLVTLQVGCPFSLKIEWVWPEDIEDAMHSHFADRRVSGEWFRVSLDKAIEVASKLSKSNWHRDLEAILDSPA